MRRVLLALLLSASIAAPVLAQSPPVYVTKSGKKYHRLGCRYLSRGRIEMTRTEAESYNYLKCKVCKP